MYPYDEYEDNRGPEDYYGKPADSCYYSTGGRYRPPKHHNYGTGLAVLGLCLLCISVIAVSFREYQLDEAESSEYETSDAAEAQAQETSNQFEAAAAPEVENAEDTMDAADAEPGQKADPAEGAEDGVAAVLEITDDPPRNSDQLSLQEIYKKVIDSVVSISASSADSTSTGTGIVMSENGYIITNYHVVENASSISVMLNDGTSYDASVIGGDELTDLMVLKIDKDGLQPAEFGDSDTVEVGDSVVAIGDPLGTELRGTMTDGIICGINRDVTVDGRTMTVIQTNAALNSGNSGGPLINMCGQVIGVNTMKMSSQLSSIEGIGFAIPISIAKPIVDELIEQGYVSGRPDFGFEVSTLDLRVMMFYNLPSRVCVGSIDENSNAAAAGIENGDIIVSVDGNSVSTTDDFNAIKNNYNAGDSITLTLYRNGSIFDVTVTLDDQASGRQ